jgi:hypothetical protein
MPRTQTSMRLKTDTLEKLKLLKMHTLINKMINWLRKLIDKCVERSLQNQSNKMFEKQSNQEEK